MNELTLSSDQQVIEAGHPLSTKGRNGAFSGDMNMSERMRFFMSQPAISKALPMLGLLAVTALAGTLWFALREPPQRDLFRGLPENDKAAVAEALGQSNIGFDFDAATGSLTVSETDYHRAKMLLAAEGLPKSAPDGDAMISSMPMGSSRAVENEKLRSAREMDLARTIEAMDSVMTARVLLAVEAPSVFIRDRSEPSASVMLTLAGGSRLGDNQVQSIIHLVASSVPGLSAEYVSVVDQNGRLISGNGTSSISDQAEQHLLVQSQVEERYRRTLVSLLTPMIGADNFTAEVNAEMDFSEKQATRESFPEKEARVRAEEGSWSNDPGERPTYGIPGALSNRPPEEAELTDEFQGDQAQGEETANNEKSRTSEKFARKFELGREISVTRETPGTLRRLSVAVALRSAVGKKQRSKEEIAAVEALVKGAIGFQAQRGDVVAIEARDFQPVEEITESWWEAEWVALLARNLSALLVALAVIFGIGRPLLKKLRGNKNDLSDGQRLQIASEIDGELANAPTGSRQNSKPVSLDMISAAAGYSQRAALIQDFVRQNPDHAALVVQDLLTEAKGEKEAANV